MQVFYYHLNYKELSLIDKCGKHYISEGSNIIIITGYFISGRKRSINEKKYSEVCSIGLCYHFETGEHKGEKTISHITAHR